MIAVLTIDFSRDVGGLAMACSIQITSVTGKRLPNQADPSSIIVTGTAQECTKVNVTIRCGLDYDPASGSANVNSNGYWAIEFIGVQNIHCKCSGSISIRAACADDETCNAEASFDLSCIVASDCPYVDDINLIIGLAKDPPCVDQPNTPVDITLTAQGPSGPAKLCLAIQRRNDCGRPQCHYGDTHIQVSWATSYSRPPLHAVKARLSSILSPKQGDQYSSLPAERWSNWRD